MDKKSIKKREIIEKSIGVIFEKGYNGAGVKDLADAAGIPKGSIYNYFENKEDYLKEALKFYYERNRENQLKILDDKSLNPIERIKEFFKFMISSLDDDGFKCGCLLGKITQEVSGTNEAIKVVTKNIQDKIISKISKNIEISKKIGLLNNDIDASDFAEFIYNSWQGALIRLKSTRDKETLDNFYKVLNEVLLK